MPNVRFKVIIFLLFILLIAVGVVQLSAQMVGQKPEPSIEVKPSASTLIDEKLNIQLSGFVPGQNVTIRARRRFDSEYVWESYATFRVGENGRVDISTQQPLTGTYQNVDAMGLFWSMEFQRSIDDSFHRNTLDPVVIDLIAEVDNTTVASTQIERLLVAPEVIKLPVHEDGLVGTLFLPGKDGPYPALITLSGSGGGLDEGRAALLASHGYATLTLAYFNFEMLPKFQANIPLEYFETAIKWLQSQDHVDAERLGVVGKSRGGELALLLGATFPEIKAIVGYVPSGLIWAGWRGSFEENVAAWTYHDRPLPYIPIKLTEEFKAYIAEQSRRTAPIAFTSLFLANMKDATVIENATIDVEKINGPVLLISGMDDQLSPSPLLSEIAIDRLKQNKHPYPYLHLSYEGAGHGIDIPYYWPTTSNEYQHPVLDMLLALGGNPKDDAFASADSWPHVLKFLDDNLVRTEFRDRKNVP